MNMRRIGSSSDSNIETDRGTSRQEFFWQQPVFVRLGSATNFVLRQGTEVILMDQGHVISACRFIKEMHEVQIEATIADRGLGWKISPLVDIEILTSVHTKLVKPTIAPGQPGLDDIIQHRIFKSKSVYVRPNEMLRRDVQLTLREEVCVFRRNLLEKIRQIDKICCCVLLTST